MTRTLDDHGGVVDHDLLDLARRHDYPFWCGVFRQAARSLLENPTGEIERRMAADALATWDALDRREGAA